MYGFDGSLIFLRNVFLLVCINTLIVLLLAFCPYKMGSLAIIAMALQDKVVVSHFFGIVATLCGYCLIGLCLLIMHTFATIIGLRGFKYIFGFNYVFIKVSLK